MRRFEHEVRQTVRDLVNLLGSAASVSLRDAQERALRIANSVAFMAVDDPSRGHLTYSSSILSVYRELRVKLVSTRSALQILGDALFEGAVNDAPAYAYKRLELPASEDAVSPDWIAHQFATRGRALYGRSFRYIREHELDGRHTVRVEKCFFYEFFRGSNAPEVTPLLCRLDYAWIEALRRKQPNIQFDRPSTLASDGVACRFQFWQKE